MNHPKVSVITAVYNAVKANREESLHQCIQSVHNQTYDAIEHIIIDGASDDGTLDIVRAYEKKGWLKVISEPDDGIYDAFNKGIKAATGKYVVFLNSDDYWSNNKGVEVSIEYLERSDADFSYAPYTYESAERGIFVSYPKVGVFFNTMPFCHLTMFTKKSVLVDFGGFDTSYRIVGDYHLINRIIMSGKKPVFVPLNFVTFREGGVSSDEEHIRLHLDELRRMRRLLWGDMIGDACDLLIDGIMPLGFDKILYSMVHPIVASDLQTVIGHYKDGSLRVVGSCSAFNLKGERVPWNYEHDSELYLVQAKVENHSLLFISPILTKLRYYRALILSKLTIGKKQLHYTEKARFFKQLYKRAKRAKKNLLKQLGI